MALLKNAIQSFLSAPGQKNEIDNLLRSLPVLAESRADHLKMEMIQSLKMAGTASNPSIPVTQILKAHTDTRAYSVPDNPKIVTETTLAIKGLLQGVSDGVVEGIGSLLARAVHTMLGTETEAERADYFIAIEMSSIVRIDVRSWVKKTEVSGMIPQLDSILAFAVSKSTVDVNKMTLNTFIMAYEFQLQRMKMSGYDIQGELLEAEQRFKRIRSHSMGERFPEAEITITEMPAAFL